MSRRHRSHSTEFKRQVVAEYHGGETLHALGRRHDLSRNLIRIWVEKADAGALDEDVAAAELMAECEARIAALERLAGRQAREIELSQKGLSAQDACRETGLYPGLSAPRPPDPARM
ncbi:Transposase and inactivated derivatives [Rhodovulum sp. ES.010]|uniref:transposase n=1 Tax=Rhodovulum sp. ES.010 TaxID=1882821 RepID=UPI0009262667|nr:transposase [Rhodovulum sp. ES.010]SIO38628.1 Transposase and inactivated derivatives [Rhodovulum sp. ES.010]